MNEEIRNAADEANRRWCQLDQRIDQLEAELDRLRHEQKRMAKAKEALDPVAKAFNWLDHAEVFVTEHLEGEPLPPGPVTNEQALAAERRMRESA